MGASALRTKILADNIANIDTPGFKRSDVNFEKMLARALDPSPRIEMNTSSSRHFETEPTRNPLRITGKVFSELDTWTRNDKSNVDPEMEMVAIAKNTLYFQAVAQRVAAKYRGMKSLLRQTPQ